MKGRIKRWKVVFTKYSEETLNELQVQGWNIYQIDFDTRGGETAVVAFRWENA